MAAVKGYVEKIKYRNEDNGYSVLSVTGADDGEAVSYTHLTLPTILLV